MAVYHDLADQLRDRITCGEWKVGVKLPSISELQEEYGIRSLNTVRAAQQRLAEEGLLETRQGVGAFVVGTESLTAVDVHGELAQIRDRLTTVLAAMGSQKRHRLTIDLDDPTEPHLYFVLTDALEEWAGRMRDRVEDEPDHPNSPHHIEWAETADRLRQKVEDAV
jgi:DNA-binding transcriptional regulator YhcF (GntR family)